ncbi:MAG: hypothetical protein ACO3JL_00815 [Myxococcota bacterium]
MMTTRKRLGQLLLDRGLIDMEQLNSALRYHRQWGVRIGAAIVAQGFLPEGTLTRVLAESLQIPMVDLAKVKVDEGALTLLNAAVCQKHQVFPIAVKTYRNRLTLLLAMADPLNVVALDEVAFTTNTLVRPAIAQFSSLDAAIRKHYLGQGVEIPPLDFTKKVQGRALNTDSEHLTLIRGNLDQLTAATLSAENEEVNLDTDLAQLDAELVPADVGANGTPTQPAQTVITGAHLNPLMSTALPAEGFDPFAGEPTGVFIMAPPTAAALPVAQGVLAQAPVVELVKTPVGTEEDRVEALEKKFWALMRVMNRRGVVTREEFLQELAGSGD